VVVFFGEGLVFDLDCCGVGFFVLLYGVDDVDCVVEVLVGVSEDC